MAPRQGSLLLAWNMGLAVLSWRYRVLWEFLNVSRYSDLKKEEEGIGGEQRNCVVQTKQI